MSLAVTARLNQRGRITLPVDADGVDANGKPEGYSGYCEADAVALLEGSKVAEIKQRAREPWLSARR